MVRDVVGPQRIQAGLVGGSGEKGERITFRLPRANSAPWFPPGHGSRGRFAIRILQYAYCNTHIVPCRLAGKVGRPLILLLFVFFLSPVRPLPPCGGAHTGNDEIGLPHLPFGVYLASPQKEKIYLEIMKKNPTVLIVIG